MSAPKISTFILPADLSYIHLHSRCLMWHFSNGVHKMHREWNTYLFWDKPVPLLGLHVGEASAYMHKKTGIFITALPTIAPDLAGALYPSMGEWINKLLYPCIQQGYKKNELLIPTQHRRIWKKFQWVRAVRHKRVCNMWFHLYEFQGQAK